MEETEAWVRIGTGEQSRVGGWAAGGEKSLQVVCERRRQEEGQKDAQISGLGV